jgi:hypothetical protein
MTIDAFPLQWPHHVPRTPAGWRGAGSFMVTPGKATSDLVAEVARSGGTNLILSSNVPLRRDGLPYANTREPDDPGVAAYFTRKGQQVCIPCDTYDRHWKNVRAIGLSIKDMRGPEMRGCAAITDAAYTGFLALPAPSAAPQGPSWWQVLNVPRNTIEDEINAAYRSKTRGLMAIEGDAARDQALKALNVARDEGLAELKAQANG